MGFIHHYHAKCDRSVRDTERRVSGRRPAVTYGLASVLRCQAGVGKEAAYETGRLQGESRP